MSSAVAAPPTRIRVPSFDWRVADWLPVDTDGAWAIERFEWTRFDVRSASWNDIMGDRQPPVGTYTRLTHTDTNYFSHTVMSDVPAEVDDHREAWERAHGKVLVHGLGLGMFVAACLRKPSVKSVTVIEKSPEVVRLVRPHLHARFGYSRLNLMTDDALTWAPAPGWRWDVAWHDIWTNIDPKNLREMKALHRRFASKVGWQGSWSRELIEGASP